MHPIKAAAALLAVGLVAGACGSASTDAPRPAAVDPNRGYAVAPVPVTIHGERFLARSVQPSGGGPPVVSTAHRAWLDDVELADVTWVDDRTLRATVPAGLPMGPHRLTVEDALGERGSAEAAYTVLAAPALLATATIDPPRVAVGQPFTVAVTVANGGGASAVSLQVAAPALTSSNGAAARLVEAPASLPTTLAAGQTATVAWRYESTAPGVLQVTAGAQATDDLSGAPLVATSPVPPAVTVQRPAALAVPASGLVIPGNVAVGSDFEVAMTVVNGGDVDARDVTPAAISILAGSTATATWRAGPQPPSATIPGGGSVRFTWTFTAGPAPGTLQLSGWAAGTDSALAAATSALPAASNRAVVVAPQHTLTVTVTGARGAVTSTPAGISCAAGNACSAAFDAGLGITLTANSIAVSWSGCDTSVANLCVVNALAADRAITARF